MTKYFLYLEHPEEYKTDDSFIAVIDSGISSEKELMHEYDRHFNFPYFGFNWNALWDCIRDFDWIEQRNIIIIHKDLPKLPEKDLKIYLPLLHDAINNWKPEENHSLTVIFPKSEQKKIEAILKRQK